VERLYKNIGKYKRTQNQWRKDLKGINKYMIIYTSK
jgi:hypothetical protein